MLLRITPGIHAHTHEYVQTGQDDSKFGFGLASGAAAAAIERAQQSAAVELVGLHAHIGSNVFAVESFAKAASVMADVARPLHLPELTLGGGLGVAYVDGEEAPVDHPVGPSGAGRHGRQPASTPGCSSSPAGPSSPRPRSPSTRSARSRTSPASAPTWRSTAA